MRGGTGERAADPLPVYFYGDYGCPYSYLAWERLELIARDRPLAVHWRPLPPPACEEVREVPSPPWRDDEEALRRGAAELELPLRLPGSRPDTRQALQAAEFARDVGPDAFRRFHRAAFAAVFARGGDVGRREALLEIAERQGLDREALAAALEDGRYDAELERAAAEADRYAISGTPGLLVGRFLLIGAAPLEVLRDTVARASAEEAADRDKAR